VPKLAPDCAVDFLYHLSCSMKYEPLRDRQTVVLMATLVTGQPVCLSVTYGLVLSLICSVHHISQKSKVILFFG